MEVIALAEGSLGYDAFQNPSRRRRTNHGGNDDNNSDTGFTRIRTPVSSSSLRSNFLFSQNYDNKNGSQQQRGNPNRNHILWGENLARKTAFTNSNKNSRPQSSTNKRTTLPELIHRKPESIHTFSYYNRCIFLDSYDKVMGVDNRGTLDVLRLGDIRSSSSSGTSSSAKVCDKRRGYLSPRHEKIVTEFEFGVELRQQFSNVHVQAVNGGSTVAFGMGNDNLYLLDLEYGEERRIYCRDGNDNNNNGIFTPISLSAAISSSSSSSFLRAYQILQPQRKYYRDRRNPSLSIYELIQHAYHTNGNHNDNHNGNNRTSDNGNISELHVIDYNAGRERLPCPVRFIPGLRPPHDARWDVLEVYPSLLHVAHVDSDYDAFWMQVLDSRIRTATATTNNAATVLIDGSTRDCSSAEEHITAVSMVTDICMATSHIYCGNYGSTPARDFFDRDLPCTGHSGMSSCIKLWDIRMAKKKNSRGGSTNNMSPIPADIIVISSTPFFRHADVALVEPVASIHTELTSGKGTLGTSRAGGSCVDDEKCVENESSIVDSDYVVTNLSANAKDLTCGANNNGSTCGGSLMVTAQSRTESTRIEHCQLNLSTFQMTRKVSQTNVNVGCQPLYAVASSRNFLATCSNRSNSINSHGNNEADSGLRSAGASTSIFIYDMHDEPPHQTKGLMRDHCYSPSLRLHQQQKPEDSTWSFRMNASLTDRYGMETELSCIAMNENGTALLGGSTDGDLFVWRGI